MRAWLAGLALAVVTAVPWAAAGDGPLSRYEWHRRLLIVFAPSEKHAQFVAQMADARQHTAGYLDRDMTVLYVAGDEPVRVSPLQPVDIDGGVLRRRFKVSGEAFRAVLVGKDGGVKFTAEKAVDACRLFGVVDGMPRRREEMAERGGAVQC